jgi:thioredoxin reductase
MILQSNSMPAVPSCSKRVPSSCDIAIIGAGPYGLSLAAHLRARGARFRIFGKPMEFWLTQMPSGMYLKSDGFASNLYDPQGTFPLRRFCTERNLPYADTGIPVPLETFTAYGLAFKQAMVPDVEEKMVVRLSRHGDGFALTLEDGEVLAVRKVVVAVGITHFAHIPSTLAHLPPEFLSHSSQHHNLEPFRGCSVAVIGAGASAVDLAALLHEAGGSVQLIARRKVLDIHCPAPLVKERPRSLWHQIRHPASGIGPGWRNTLLADAPLLFHYMPTKFRLRVTRTSHGPAAGWFMQEKVDRGLPVRLGCHLEHAEIRHGRVHLTLRSADDNVTRTVALDHIIAATGYVPDVRRLSFLTTDILSQLKLVAHTPVLSSRLQSSIPGLYFAGAVAANSFGPVLRFAFGAGFAARRLAPALLQQR